MAFPEDYVFVKNLSAWFGKDGTGPYFIDAFGTPVELGGSGVPDGGTTGQVLTKASNTDGDVEWGTPAGGGDLLSTANLSDLASATTALTNLGLSANAKSFVTAADYAAMRTAISLVPGTNVQAQDAFLQMIADLADPNADAITFWDDSASTLTWLTIGSGLQISGTTLSATGGAGLTDQDYGDITVSGGGATMTIDAGAVTYAKMQDVSATSRVLGRKTAGAGDVEELTFSEVLDFVTSASHGDLMYRGATTWTRLAAGTDGQFLKTQGAAANPIWASVPGGGDALTTNTLAQFASTTSAQLAGVINDETGSGALVFATSPTLVTPNIGTPSAGLLTNCSGLPVAGLSGLGAGMSTFLTTPTSANLKTAVTDETGSGGSLVFATSPTITTPTFSGVVTSDGAEVLSANAMGALVIDTSKGVNTKSIAADSTFTFSGAPAAQTWFHLLVTNTDSAPHRLTMPTVFNMATATSAAHVVVIQAAGRLMLSFRYDGSAYEMHGDPGYLDKLDATTAPTVNEDLADGYGPGSFWLDATNNNLYICESAAAGAAVWHNTTASGGDVTKVGTPVDNQIGVWTGSGTIEGDTALTFDTSTDTLTIAASGNLAFGAVTILDDAAGTMTLGNIDAIDATTEATIEAAIDTLANLTSIQGRTVTLADAGADAIFGWDDSANAYQNLSAADVRAAASAAAKTGQAWGISATFQGAGADDDVVLVQYAPWAGTITSTVTDCDSGTATYTFKINGTNLGGTANSVSSTEQSQSHASANTFVAGDTISVTRSANSSCTNGRLSIVGTRDLS